MAARRIFCITLLALVSIPAIEAQDKTPSAVRDTPIPQLLPGSARPADIPAGRAAGGPDAVAPQHVPLTVPKGTSLQVALEKEVRIQRVGQRVNAQVIEPVYAFDHLVVPVGSMVRGEVTIIGSSPSLAASARWRVWMETSHPRARLKSASLTWCWPMGSTSRFIPA